MMFGLGLAVVSSGFTAPLGGIVSSGPLGGRARAMRMGADFDPFSAPRGPPLESQQPPPPFAPPPNGPPSEDEPDQEVVLGARVLGSLVGGTAGNGLFSGLASTGIIACSPFDLEACEALTAAAPAVSAPQGGASSASAEAAMDSFPFADILRNPTSILPQAWRLEGRRYLNDLDLEPTTPPSAEPAAVPAAPPGLGDVPALTTLAPTSVEPAASTVAPTSVEPAASELSELASAPARPLGVSPASAYEPDGSWSDEMMASADAWRDAAAHVPSAHALEIDAHTLVASGQLSSQSAALLAEGHGSVLEGAGFAAIADGGGGPAVLIATALSAGLGALAFEYVATNKAPPIPDPLLGGLWSGLHGGTRAASKLSGFVVSKAAAAVKGVLPFG